MRQKKALFGTLALALTTAGMGTVSRYAAAQQGKPLDPNAPIATTPVGAGAVAPYTPPTVNDPMLIAPAGPKREVASWVDAVALTRSRSTDLATALAEVTRAEAQTRVAFAAILPTINGSVSYPHQFITKETQVLGSPGDPPRTVTSPQSDYFNAGLTLQQSVVNVQSWHSIKTSKENEKAEKLTAEDTSRQITLGVARSVVAVVAAERVAELNRIGLRTALERRELTSRKQVLGVGTGLDVVRADQDVSSARAAIVSGDESLRKSRESLGLALGFPEQVGVAKGISVDAVAQEAERTCPRLDQLDQRADIASGEKRLEIAGRNVDNVKLGFLPTIGAQSNFSTTTADLGNSAQRSSWSITAVLSVPIWDGGARYGALRSARALRDEAGFSLEAQRRNATIEIAQARRSVTVAESALDVARQTRELAARVDQLTQTAYRAGQGTSLELVTAAAALRSAEVSLALREFDVVSARLDALFALSHCTTTT
ncbi:MAG: Heavy metal efflux outer membrane protein CzcC family [Labilithrix sp.]|nr:Heavy metal efflux outer membrane protein CzcC family [Labilithrix sp.]